VLLIATLFCLFTQTVVSRCRRTHAHVLVVESSWAERGRAAGGRPGHGSRVFAVTLDVTVLTVALPTLAGALKASESQLQWFVTAYTLASGRMLRRACSATATGAGP